MPILFASRCISPSAFWRIHDDRTPQGDDRSSCSLRVQTDQMQSPSLTTRSWSPQSKTVDSAEGDPLRRLSSQHIKVVAQRHNLCLERSTRSAEPDGETPD